VEEPYCGEDGGREADRWMEETARRMGSERRGRGGWDWGGGVELEPRFHANERSRIGITLTHGIIWVDVTEPLC
jgi:hypothetical protein